MKKKIRYSEFTTPAPPPLTRFTPISSSAVARPTPVVPPVAVPAGAASASAAPAPVAPTPASPASVTPTRGSTVVPEPLPVRKPSAPVDLARALAQARATEALRAAETLSHVEARAAAAHARGIAEAQAASLAAALEPSAVEETRSIASEPAAPPTMEVEARDPQEDDLDEPRGPRRPLRERARNREGIAELLMFRIGRERFAVELMCVEEAIDLPDVHHVPEMPPAMLGVITVRGTLTPVFTPDGALGVPVRGKGAALIFRSVRGRFALAIDDVDDVMTLDMRMLRDAPGSDIADSVVLGVARNEGVIVALVDADALVLACQAIPVLELA